ncbi:unnamed protein product, partial [Urochloa humidicola]
RAGLFWFALLLQLGVLIYWAAHHSPIVGPFDSTTLGEGRPSRMARSVSYVSAAKVVSMARGNPRLAIIDVRDEERSYQAHIAGSHHFASGSFEARMPELARAASGKDTLVFHCALSQVRGPTCAKMFSHYLGETKEDSGIKNIMILEHGFNGWEVSGQPVCRCTDAPCKGTCC